MMTARPFGRLFGSYNRARGDELTAIERELYLLGVPTWRDTRDVPFGHTPTEIERAIKDPATSGALLLLTPEIAASPYVLDLEVPEIFARVRRDPTFMIVPIAAGGLSYEEATVLVQGRTGSEPLDQWNIHRVENDPLTANDARAIALRVLRQRLRIIMNGSGFSPLPINVCTRDAPAFRSDEFALALDHRSAFALDATASATSDVVDALRTLRQEISSINPLAWLEISGQVHLSHALALGAIFVATSGLRLTWIQNRAGYPSERWELLAAEPSSIPLVNVRRGLPRSHGVALVVSISDSAERAFSTVYGAHGPFGATAFVDARSMAPLTPATASVVAHRVAAAAREARALVPECGDLHVFYAGPAGLALMIGQLLTTFDGLVTYEYAADRYMASLRVSRASTALGIVT